VKAGSDRLFGAGWCALGTAVLAASWRMDRLEGLHINPWSVPGLLPGLLGALMILFGAALFLRGPGANDGRKASGTGRTWLALLLCVGFAAGLLGHGLPFWLTAAGFMFVAILSFRWLDREAEAPGSLRRLALESAAIAIAASVAISLLFQEVFLVRLP
jgi:Tripartite tricarboxylate transporter TctB family